MTNDKISLLETMFARLCFHAGATPEQFSRRRIRFIESLSPYPDDLLCAAYQHLLHHTRVGQMPGVDAFIEFMAPEFARRQQCMEDA